MLFFFLMMASQKAARHGNDAIGTHFDKMLASLVYRLLSCKKGEN